ncbi:hypothetical protein NEISICOT_02997 [Neisseria sicca ATCC 29256]|uniref:Uncharacterized protein n=1 Tax=Neisseria sicca ATCC 29256 TaxID=547045 RepID=C6M8X1_NEISI|nr:hypothetical protein NEISICOT_02997 [Neisseria sicca ATCC 29256]
MLGGCIAGRQNRSSGNAQNSRFHHIIFFRYRDSDDLSPNFRERFSKVLKHQVNRFRTICTVCGFVALS